ncbi:piercer of microtubule wall 2 protein [Mantella aurantiaca]
MEMSTKRRRHVPEIQSWQSCYGDGSAHSTGLSYTEGTQRNKIKTMSSFEGQTPASVCAEEQSKVTCVSPGNPVFSCTATPKTSPGSVFQTKPVSILFRTTSSQYGALRPSREMAPCYHYPMSQTFSQHLGTCGIYRNHSLNTAIDRSRVHDCMNLNNTL